MMKNADTKALGAYARWSLCYHDWWAKEKVTKKVHRPHYILREIYSRVVT